MQGCARRLGLADGDTLGVMLPGQPGGRDRAPPADPGRRRPRLRARFPRLRWVVRMAPDVDAAAYEPWTRDGTASSSAASRSSTLARRRPASWSRPPAPPPSRRRSAQPPLIVVYRVSPIDLVAGAPPGARAARGDGESDRRPRDRARAAAGGLHARPAGGRDRGAAGGPGARGAHARRAGGAAAAPSARAARYGARRARCGPSSRNEGRRAERRARDERRVLSGGADRLGGTRLLRGLGAHVAGAGHRPRASRRPAAAPGRGGSTPSGTGTCCRSPISSAARGSWCSSASTVTGSTSPRSSAGCGSRPCGARPPAAASARCSRCRALRPAGRLIGITPDGPRGPRRQAQPGVLIVAQRAGMPIVPVTVAVAHPGGGSTRWDRFVIPPPFARVVMAFGAPHPRSPAALERTCRLVAEWTARGGRCALQWWRSAAKRELRRLVNGARRHAAGGWRASRRSGCTTRVGRGAGRRLPYGSPARPAPSRGDARALRALGRGSRPRRGGAAVGARRERGGTARCPAAAARAGRARDRAARPP